MELAFFIQRASQLGVLADALCGRFPSLLGHATTARFSGCRVGRVYYGHETCQHALPAADDLMRLQELVLRHDLKLSFVTPLCTDAGLARIKDLVKHLTEACDELVVNDYGVLHELANAEVRVKMVMGRLLARAKKWPFGEIPSPALDLVRDAPYGFTEHQELLSRYRVTRVEFDNRKEGYGAGLDALGVDKTLHVPYVFLAAERMCLLAGQRCSGKEKFGIPVSCQHDCDTTLLRLNGSVFSNGCGHYSVNDSPLNPEDQRFSRLVLSLSI